MLPRSSRNSSRGGNIVPPDHAPSILVKQRATKVEPAPVPPPSSTDVESDASLVPKRSSKAKSQKDAEPTTGIAPSRGRLPKSADAAARVEIVDGDDDDDDGDDVEMSTASEFVSLPPTSKTQAPVDGRRRATTSADSSYAPPASAAEAATVAAEIPWDDFAKFYHLDVKVCRGGTCDVLM